MRMRRRAVQAYVYVRVCGGVGDRVLEGVKPTRMPKIKVPSSDQKEPQAKKKHVRLKNAFPPSTKERRSVARAQKLAKQNLSAAPRKAAPSFQEAFGSSDDEVS